MAQPSWPTLEPSDCVMHIRGRNVRLLSLTFSWMSSRRSSIAHCVLRIIAGCDAHVRLLVQL